LEITIDILQNLGRKVICSQAHVDQVLEKVIFLYYNSLDEVQEKCSYV